MIEKLSSLCVRFMPTFVSPATSIRSGPPTMTDRRKDADTVSTRSAILGGLTHSSRLASHGGPASTASRQRRERRRGGRSQGSAKGDGDLVELIGAEHE